MLLISICGIVFLGSFLSSALSFARAGYSAHKAQKDLKAFKGMINGSEKFLAERYVRLQNELVGEVLAD